ncbi:hypothetical protein MARLIPOL_18268 [Marinobacter lipolyticus SM19]|uniref:DUF6968 domain-containing protein n=1 Tax=Marinobacter lipolyticus SM19 TaxID=1318628 RepID=R8AW57_9GAMM|nr:hypothetical protein [Marinobacter lipolyticus]EON90541.1 hypothetical protein MARLIPOL_18268 [Marinobacter lipolyticus SM19]
MMPKIEEVRDIIATRELVYISSSGEREKATIEIGKPYQIENEAYVCPYRVGSLSYEHIYGSVGIDSFQALELSLKTMEAELIYWVRKKGGSFEFLGEPGTGLEKNA